VVLTKIKEEKEKLNKELKEKTVGYILAALGLVAGLAWNEAIKSTIDQFFPYSGNSIFIKFIYAFVVTVCIVLFTFYFLKANNNQEKK